MPSDFHVSIEGENVSPETVALEDVLDILRDLKTAIFAAAIDAGQLRNEVFLSLKSVRSGSDLLTLFESEAARVGSSRITTAVRNYNLDDIPVLSQRALRKLWLRGHQRGWAIALQNGEPRAVIDPKREFPVQRYITGATTIIATIERIGGEGKPTVLVRRMGGERRTFPVISKAVAEQIGGRLYRKAVLTGEAKWSATTSKLVHFKVASMGRFDERTADPVAALRRMAEISKGRWDSVDPDAYVHDERADD